MATNSPQDKNLNLLNKKLKLAGEHLKRLAVENEKLSVTLEDYQSKEKAWLAEKESLLLEREQLENKNEKTQSNNTINTTDRAISPIPQPISELSQSLENGIDATTFTSTSAITDSYASENIKLLTDWDSFIVKVIELFDLASLNQTTQVSNFSEKKQTKGKEKGKEKGKGKGKTAPAEDSVSAFVHIDKLEPEKLLQSLKEYVSTASKFNKDNMLIDENKQVNELSNVQQNLADGFYSKLEVLLSVISTEKLDKQEKKTKETPTTTHKLTEKRQTAIYEKVRKLMEQTKTFENKVSDLEKQVQEKIEELTDVTEDKRTLENDYKLLLDKLSLMQNALKAKLKAETDELSKLKRQNTENVSTVEEQSREIYRLTQENKSLNTQLLQLKNELDGKAMEHKGLVEMHELKARKNVELLSSQIDSLNTQCENLEKQLSNMFEENSYLENKYNNLKYENESLQVKIDNFDSERTVLNTNITNLQLALDSLQQGTSGEIVELQNVISDLNARNISQLNEYESKIADLSKRLKEYNDKQNEQHQNAQSVDKLKGEISSQQLMIAQLRQQIVVLNDNLNTSLQRLKDENDDNVLDKRLITSLIVGFFAIPYGDSKRFEVLQLIANILHLTEQQRQTVSLSFVYMLSLERKGEGNFDVDINIM
ncbi:GRIP domain-containing protein [Zancudomyces culisetae]|uniref:GRIP domain-containing protein n=1 Tax=Zancudomyces culisetae TaxID=1213189 RepID=A0A1R1PHE7_ZANCU|nr:GRIP domain-containing protein [Zancudomyces culisetae]|eukprot:OMH80400.1 GRIP domain-containing protein [Zancudomyces culisetae]